MKIRHLTFCYPKNRKIIFDDLSMDIVPHKINVLLGMNGEGKTTLFDIVSGLIRTDTVIDKKIPPKDILYQIQGVPILSTIRGKDLAELILCSSGQYFFRDLSPYLFETPLGNDPDSMRKIDCIWDTQYGKMSPGERHLFTILLYCLLDKSLYIFDEPTAGVDPFSARQIARLISRLQEREGKTILYATHVIQDLMNFPHYQVHILHSGKIVLSENDQNWVQACRKMDLPFLNDFIGAWDRGIQS